MSISSQFKLYAVVIAVFCGFMLLGCGASQEKTELTGILENYEKLVNDYEAINGSNDQQKKAEIEKQIMSLSALWTEKRNEYGSSITPQDMDALAKKFDVISNKLSELKKKSG
jgi:hypothetical protein